MSEEEKVTDTNVGNIDKDIEILENLKEKMYFNNENVLECALNMKEQQSLSNVLQELSIREKMIDSMSNEIYLEKIKENGQHFKTSEEVKEFFRKETEDNE